MSILREPGRILMIVRSLISVACVVSVTLVASACVSRNHISPEVAAAGNAQTATARGPTPPPSAVPPVASKKPYQVPSPNGAREDDYYWLRDDTRQSAEVLDYLNRENAYRDAGMTRTDALQQKVY